MKLLMVALAAAATASALPKWSELDDYSFEKYIVDFERSYCVAPSSDECSARRGHFEANFAKISAQNADALGTWKAGVNHLTDRSPEELLQLRGYRSDMLADDEMLAVATPYVPTNSTTASAAAQEVRRTLLANEIARENGIDWTTKGATTAVKDQGSCGSCWAFATAETVESHHQIKHGDLVDLSPQQVAMCSPNPKNCGGTGGCGGGTAEVGFAGIIKAGGLASEWTDPYVSHQGKNQPCKFDIANGTKPVAAAKVISYTKLPENEYAPILDALSHIGPLAVAVDASAWHLYESGVFGSGKNGCNAEHPDIDHLVQLVGFGTDPKLGDYWKIRNSWTPTWGESGFIRLKRQKENAECGLDTTPMDGSGCEGGPKTVRVCGTCGVLYDVSFPLMA